MSTFSLYVFATDSEGTVRSQCFAEHTSEQQARAELVTLETNVRRRYSLTSVERIDADTVQWYNSATGVHAIACVLDDTLR